MFKKLKPLIYTRPFIVFAYYLIRIYSLTFRMQVINEQAWQDQLSRKKTVLLCTWHQQFFAAIRHFKTYTALNPGLMISQSRDGDLISGVANRSGWHTPRGSSSRGGKKAMQAMINHLSSHRFGAHILDGPTGPIGKVKPGIVKMAQDTDAVVIPFHIEAGNAWFFNSWDRFMLPKPFSKVVLRFGEAVQFPYSRDAQVFEDQRRHLETMMQPHLIL
jgi:lysophospholipid acyltransferase (LPLAT)-like uncharacterized protein